MIFGKERLALLSQNPLPLFLARGFALNGNRFCRVLVCNHNVDAASVSERDGSDKPTAGEFGGNEVFARDASEEGCGAHEILGLPDETKGVEAFDLIGR